MGYRQSTKHRAQTTMPKTKTPNMKFWEDRPAIVSKAIYTLEEAAFVLGVAKSVVDWARYGEGDKRLGYSKVGKSIRFTGEELLRWVRACEAPEGQVDEELEAVKGLTLDQVYHAALQLPDGDRKQLIERLTEEREER